MIKRPFYRMYGKYQFGGDDDTDFFNSLADESINEQQDTSGEDQEQPDEEQPDVQDNDTSDLEEKYQDLQDRFSELEQKVSSAAQPSVQSDDGFLNFLFSDDGSNLPVTFDNSDLTPSKSEPTEEGSGPNMETPYGSTYSDVEEEVPGDKKRLAKKESSSTSSTAYKATNPNSTATGKYQFLWGKRPGTGWGDTIKKVTGVKNREQFLNDPKAQENFFEWYDKNFLVPSARELQKYNKKGLTNDQMKDLIHLRGRKGAIEWLTGKAKDQPEKYNKPTSQYIAEKKYGGNNIVRGVNTFISYRNGKPLPYYAEQQYGGNLGGAIIANTLEAQYNGLNNNKHKKMFFPKKGFNTFRGLDSGKPVLLHDQRGKKVVLRGKHHTASMYGNVFEKRLKK